MNKFDEKLYHLLSEYFPKYKDKKLSQKAKRKYIALLIDYLQGDKPNYDWHLVFTQELIQLDVALYFASALASIKDEWELADL